MFNKQHNSSRRSIALPLIYRLHAVAITLLLLATSAIAQSANEHAELPKFHRQSERLYRGAQPRQGGLRRLSELGITTVVNLRGADRRALAEASKARALGLRYFNIPMPVWGRPTDEQVRRVMEIINAEENGRVFIHCKDGVDRTGTIVAIHRITNDGWTASDATAEAMRYGMRRIQYWMRDYIDDYYDWQQRASDATSATASKNDGHDVKSRIGAGVRVGEREVFRTQRLARRRLRSARLSAVSDFFGKVF